MYSFYDEFVTLENIESAVDKLFKGYLDTVLINIASANESESEAYWEAVEDFRRDRLDPFTLPPGAKHFDDAERIKREKIRNANLKEFEHAENYLYWFDARAKYRETNLLEESIRKVIPPAEALDKLLDEAQSLLTRIEEARKDLKVPVTTDCKGLLKWLKLGAKPFGKQKPTPASSPTPPTTKKAVAKKPAVKKAVAKKPVAKKRSKKKAAKSAS